MIRLPARWARFVRASMLTVAVLGCGEATPTESLDLIPSTARQTTSGPVVSSTVPSSAARGTTLDVRILGSGFDAGSTAQWAIDGVPSGKVVVNGTSYVSSKELKANITIASDADVTFYDIVVTSKGGKPGIGTETFEVTVQVVNLGTLGGDSEALAVNDLGQVTGYSGTSSGGHVFLWENGVMRDLGVPAGFTSARGEAINNHGHVAGYAMRQVDGAWQSRAFRWTPEKGMELLPGDNSVAHAINDAGMIAGWAKRPDGTGSGAVWIDGVIQFLPIGAGDIYDINSSGVVVVKGSPQVQSGSNCCWNTVYTWSLTEGLRPVATLLGSLGEPLGINDDGAVVGWGPVPGMEGVGHAFVSAAGVATDLSEPAITSSAAYKIASNGLIAGRYKPNVAALWLPDGSRILLGATEAFDVNARGEVVGYINVPGYSRRTTRKQATMWKVN